MSPWNAESTKKIYSTFDANQLKAFKEKLEIDHAIAIPDVSKFRVNAFHQSNGKISSGRVPAFEIMLATSAIRNLIR